jgi:hypothetical protein
MVRISPILARILTWKRVRPNASPQTTRPSKRRRAVVVAISTLAAFLLLHLGLVLATEFSLFLRDPLYGDKERKLTHLIKALPPASPTVVFLGTSRTSYGFDAGQAQGLATEKVGQPVCVFNWGIYATGPVSHLIHLRRMVADHHHPDLLLLEVLPPTLADLPDGPLESRFTVGTTLDWSELDLVTDHGFPSDRLRSTRREVAIAPWYGLRFQILGRLMPYWLPHHLRYDWSRGPDPNGWGPIALNGVSEEQRATALNNARQEYQEILAHMKLGNGPMRALREMLDLCRKENVRVTLILMPEGTGIRSLYPPRVDAEIDRFLSELATEYGCGICDARTWLADDAFFDGHHMLRPGAAQFTERLTREVIEPALRSGIDQQGP